MKLPRISLVLGLSLVAIFMLEKVQEVDSIYAYAVKGVVKDFRLHPTRFIGSYFFKKAFLLKKLKIKLKLIKKLILKKLLKKKLLLLKGRKRRAVRFPEDDEDIHSSQSRYPAIPNQQFESRPSVQQPRVEQQQQGQQGQSQQQGQQASNPFNNVQTFGLSQSDLDQLRQLPDNLQREYGQEMEQLEASASEPKEEEIQDYLSMASEFDSNSCIPKSICEIMATAGNRTTTQFETQILEFYSDPENRERRAGTPAYVYDNAAYLGLSTRDPRSCAGFYTNCPETPQALFRFMNEVFAPEVCEYPPPYPSYGSGSYFSNNQLAL